MLLNCITTGFLRGGTRGEVLIGRHCHSCECGELVVHKHFLITSDAPLLGHVGEVVEGGGCGEKSAAVIFTPRSPTKLLQPLCCRGSRSISNMFKLCRAPVAPILSAAAFRNASRLGFLRSFSSNVGGQPMQAWVPTPYVTETIVRLLKPSDLATSKLT